MIKNNMYVDNIGTLIDAVCNSDLDINLLDIKEFNILGTSNRWAFRLNKKRAQLINKYYLSMVENGYINIANEELVSFKGYKKSVHQPHIHENFHGNVMNHNNPNMEIHPTDGNIYLFNKSVIYDRVCKPLAIYESRNKQDSSQISYSVIDRFKKRYNVNLYQIGSPESVELTVKEKIIVYGLLAKLTLQEIANLLNLSRHYVKDIINLKLCEKFNIQNGSSKILTEYFIALGYYHFIPHELLYNKAVILHTVPSQFYSTETITNHKLLAIQSFLINGFTQEEIASRLQMSRSNVHKVIRTHMYKQSLRCE